MKTTTSRAVIDKLNEIFAIFGYPHTIRSDNGPPFKSKRLRSYFDHLGIKHEKITPFWPRRNGIVESFMKNINKTVRTASVSRKDWKCALTDLLMTYRNTPHTVTNQKPSMLMFNRNIRAKLPSIRNFSPLYETAKTWQQKAYEHARAAKINREIVPPAYKMNDTVLLKRAEKTKL